MDPGGYVSSGEPLAISARAYNAFVEAARWTDRQRRSGTAGAIKTGIVRGVDCWALNATGADLDWFSVVGLDKPLFGPDDLPANQQGGENADFLHAPSLRLVAPDETQHALRFAVTIEPIAANLVGRIRLSGLVPCKVEWHAGGRLAGIKNNTRSALQTGPIGWPIVWAADSGSTRWALLHAGPPTVTTAWGQLDADLDARPASGALDSAVLSLYTLSTANEPLDTGRDITVFNPWGRDFSAAAYCQAEFDGERWLLTGGDC